MGVPICLQIGLSETKEDTCYLYYSYVQQEMLREYGPKDTLKVYSQSIQKLPIYTKNIYICNYGCYQVS